MAHNNTKLRFTILYQFGHIPNLHIHLQYNGYNNRVTIQHRYTIFLYTIEHRKRKKKYYQIRQHEFHVFYCAVFPFLQYFLEKKSKIKKKKKPNWLRGKKTPWWSPTHCLLKKKLYSILYSRVGTKTFYFHFRYNVLLLSKCHQFLLFSSIFLCIF
jgi:hypothetical protein